MIKALIAGTLAVVAAFVIARGSIAKAQTVTVTPPAYPSITPEMTTTITPTPTMSLPSGAPKTGFH